jgi:hypothetical protein
VTKEEEMGLAGSLFAADFGAVLLMSVALLVGRGVLRT